jgi:hypothetical protein
MIVQPGESLKKAMLIFLAVSNQEAGPLFPFTLTLSTNAITIHTTAASSITLERRFDLSHDWRSYDTFSLPVSCQPLPS